jgi:hypothetical protein
VAASGEEKKSHKKRRSTFGAIWTLPQDLGQLLVEARAAEPSTIGFQGMPFGRKKNKKSVGSDQEDESGDPILLYGAGAADVQITHDATGRPRYPTTVGQLIVETLGEPLISEHDTEAGESEDFNPPSPDYMSPEKADLPITEESLEAVNGEWQGPMASILCPFPTYRPFWESDDTFAFGTTDSRKYNVATFLNMDLANMANESRTQRTREEAGRAAFKKAPPLFLYDDPVGCCVSPSAATMEFFPVLYVQIVHSPLGESNPEDENGDPILEFKSSIPESGKIAIFPRPDVLCVVLCCLPCFLASGCALGANCPGAMRPVSHEFVQSYEGRLEDRGAWCKDLSCGRVDVTASSGMGQPLISERQVITNQPELIAAGNQLVGRSVARGLVEDATIPEYLRLGIDAEGFAGYLVRIKFLRRRSDEEVARILNYKGNEDLSETPESIAFLRSREARLLHQLTDGTISPGPDEFQGPDTWSHQELQDEFQLLARMPMLRYTYDSRVHIARYEDYTTHNPNKPTNEKWIDEAIGELKLDAVFEMSGQNLFFSRAWFEEAEKVFPWFPRRGSDSDRFDNQQSDRDMIRKEFNWDRWWGVTGYDITGYIK